VIGIESMLDVYPIVCDAILDDKPSRPVPAAE